MYLDLFDTVKTSPLFNSSCKLNDNFERSELYLLYMLILGKKPTLTDTQIIDSNVIFKITQSKYKEIFYRLIESNRIRILVHSSSSSVNEYYSNTLRFGMNEDAEFYNYSSIPFLNEYEAKERIHVQKKMIDALAQGTYKIDSNDIIPLHKEYLNEILLTIGELNLKTRKTKTIRVNSSKRLDLYINSTIDSVINDVRETETYELFERIKRLNGENRRSMYYNFLSSLKNEYRSDSLEYAREIIDFSYNTIRSEMISDVEGTKLTLPTLVSKNKINHELENKLFPIEKNIITESANTHSVTWENIIDILDDLESIEKEMACTRREAIDIYIAKISKAPFLQVGKYIGITATTIPFLGLPIFEIIPDLVTNVFGDAISEKYKKPSISEIITTFKNTDDQKRIIRNADMFDSIVFGNEHSD
ncbi:hypothetical protein [Fusibacter ferrireducens]|uniref:Uncharacterized protein n=1 Tax=Fusibacter ferrireducens TaxID=2785058 RepID=A0ABR9ZU15_9FIRM|nr:hypothetical protein [Fusibacter ferrireducens]MBF4693958.1 hypothetical protein [Fusibacter ferrireducens]